MMTVRDKSFTLPNGANDYSGPQNLRKSKLLGSCAIRRQRKKPEKHEAFEHHLTKSVRILKGGETRQNLLSDRIS